VGVHATPFGGSNSLPGLVWLEGITGAMANVDDVHDLSRRIDGIDDPIDMRFVAIEQVTQTWVY
jgi:hypothetical protein